MDEPENRDTQPRGMQNPGDPNEDEKAREPEPEQPKIDSQPRFSALLRQAFTGCCKLPRLSF